MGMKSINVRKIEEDLEVMQANTIDSNSTT